ncbi:MAG TPA: HAD family hydrolase [Candidatus Saccharimonadales bacterium]|nr:HAD family hydrolase [Candidatus Saccharimonadales bacterium]
MEKMSACYDVDGTLAKGMLVIPLMMSEYEHGIINENTFAKLNDILSHYKSGDVTYEIAAQQLLKAHAAGLEGQSENDLETHANKFVQQNDGLFRSFGKNVINLLKPYYKQVIVTTEPQYLAEAIVDYYDADEVLSTQYEVEGGKFTGRISSSLADRVAKLDALRGRKVAYAFGDSESDIEMLRMATNAFCIDPTDGLRKLGLESGWHIYDGSDSRIVQDIQRILKTD